MYCTMKAWIFKTIPAIPPSFYSVLVIAVVVYGNFAIAACLLFCVVLSIAWIIWSSQGSKPRSRTSILVFVLLGMIIATYVRVYTYAHQLRFPVHPADVVMLEGVLKNDAIYSGNRYVRHVVWIEDMHTHHEVHAEATGFLEVFAQITDSGYRGDRVILHGYFYDNTGSTGENSREYTLNTGNTSDDASHWRFRVDDIEIHPVTRGIVKYRRRLFLAISQRISALPPRISGLLQSLFLGDRSYLDPIIADRFRKSGNAHVLALSGMHLSLLSLVLTLLFQLFFNQRTSLCIVLCVLTGYCILVGPIPSLVRAYSMIFVFCLARLGRVVPRLSMVFFISFALCAIVYPRLIYEISFMLSSLAILGFVVFLKPVASLLKRYLPQVIATAFSASIAPIVASAPIVLYSFGHIYTGGIVVSVVLGGVISVFLVVGIVYILFPSMPLLPILLEWLYFLSLDIIGIGQLFPAINWKWFIGCLVGGAVVYGCDRWAFHKKSQRFAQVMLYPKT